MGFFAVDAKTIDYYRSTGRSADAVAALEGYWKAQQMFGVSKKGDIDYTEVLSLDLDTVRPSLSGPKRPQDRIELGKLKSKFTELFAQPPANNGFSKKPEDLPKRFKTRHGVEIRPRHSIIAA